MQRGERLVDREDPRVGDLAQAALEADGVDVRTGRTVTAARRDAHDTLVTLDDGTEMRTGVIVLGAGRRPRTAYLGLDTAGGELDEQGGVAIDDHCRAGEGLWALGDVTAVALFTHVAMYQGRIVADNILGKDRPARYDGIPRVIFADPEIAAVGLTTGQARERGLRLATAEVKLADAIARPWTFERDPRGTLGVLADRDRGLLVGTWAVAPLASEWIHQASLAISSLTDPNPVRLSHGYSWTLPPCRHVRRRVRRPSSSPSCRRCGLATIGTVHRPIYRSHPWSFVQSDCSWSPPSPRSGARGSCGRACASSEVGFGPARV